MWDIIGDQLLLQVGLNILLDKVTPVLHQGHEWRWERGGLRNV